MNRYFLQAGAWTEHTLTLTGEEARHATRVMRAKAGEQIIVFDGQGTSATCTIASVERNEVLCDIAHTSQQPKPAHPITLCQAIPKGGNMELIVQKAVELGVNTIQPLITAHTVVRPDAMAKKQAKWQRIALEACKQCGQDHLPHIKGPLSFSQWIQQGSEADTRIVAALDPKAVHFKSLFHKSPATGGIELLIGPEGDLSPEEYQQAYAAGFQPVSFGHIVLRVETASIYGLSVLKHELSCEESQT